MKKTLGITMLLALSTAVYCGQEPRKDVESEHNEKEPKDCCERAIELFTNGTLRAGEFTIAGGVWAIKHTSNGVFWAGTQAIKAGTAVAAWYHEQNRLYEMERIKGKTALLEQVLNTQHTNTPNLTKASSPVSSRPGTPTAPQSTPMSPFENVSRTTSPTNEGSKKIQ